MLNILPGLKEFFDTITMLPLIENIQKCFLPAFLVPVVTAVQQFNEQTGGIELGGLVGASGQPDAPTQPAPVIPYAQAESFVINLYRTMLKREPDAGGLSYWTNLLVSGQATFSGVREGFKQSPEYKVTVKKRTRNIFIYVGIVIIIVIAGYFIFIKKILRRK